MCNARNRPQRAPRQNRTLPHTHNRARNQGRRPSHVPVVWGETDSGAGCCRNVVGAEGTWLNARKSSF